MRFLVLSLCIVSALPQSAAAYEEQVVATFDTGYANAPGNDEISRHGVSLGIGANIGLNDAWSIHNRIGYVFHPGAAQTHVIQLGIETIYLVDILEFIPFFGVGIDFFSTFSSDNRGIDVGVHALIGLDWLISRNWLVGLEIRPHFIPFQISSGLDSIYLTMTARVGLIFERF